MAFKVKKDKVYGDFQAVARIDAERGLFKTVCVHCGKTKNYLATTLKGKPEHDCPRNDIAEVKNAQALSLKTLGEALKQGESRGEALTETYSMFLEQQEHISALLEQADSAEGVRAFQMASLKMLVDLIPYAERVYRDDPKQSNVYSLNALLAQFRELTADLNAENDQSALVDSVMNSIMQPAFLQIGQVLVDQMYALRKEIEGDISVERKKRANKAMDETMRGMAKAFQSIFYDMKRQVAEKLS